MSSACYVYAIMGRGAPSPVASSGGDFADLAMVPWRELAAVTGGMEGDSAPLTTTDVLRHEAIVEAARRQGPALPVRFGTVFRDADSVAGALAERYEPLVADLERIGDKVELSLTALWAAVPSGDVAAPDPRQETVATERGAGALYLYARAAESRREDAVREMARGVSRGLDQVLGPLALEQRTSLVPTPRIAVRTAYLLDPAAVGAFRADFEELRRTRRDLRLLLTGPWPPYSFVSRPHPEGGGISDGRLEALARLLTDETRVRPG